MAKPVRTSLALLLLLVQPTHEALLVQTNHEHFLNRRILIQGAASASLLLSPTAAHAKRKKAEEAPKCYDSKFKEIPCAGAFDAGALSTSSADLPDSWRAGGGTPIANPNMKTVTYDGVEVDTLGAIKGGTGASVGTGKANQPLRTYIPTDEQPSLAAGSASPTQASAKASGPLDVNNMVAVEFASFPGLYPTIGGKLIKAAPFKKKEELYACLDSDAERSALKQYEKSIVLKPRDDDLYQYKTAGFYFPGKGGTMKGGKTSNAFRDEEIKRLQSERKL